MVEEKRRKEGRNERRREGGKKERKKEKKRKLGKRKNAGSHWADRLLAVEAGRERGGGWNRKIAVVCASWDKRAEDRLKVEEAAGVGGAEKSSFSWRLSSKSTSSHHIAPGDHMFRWLCSPLFCHGKYDRFYPPSSSFSSFSLRRYRIVWEGSRLLRFINYVTSVHTCIDAGYLHFSNLFPSLPSFPHSLLFPASPRWIGLNHCFLSPIAYSRSSGSGSVRCITIRPPPSFWLIPRIVRNYLYDI